MLCRRENGIPRLKTQSQFCQAIIKCPTHSEWKTAAKHGWTLISCSHSPPLSVIKYLYLLPQLSHVITRDSTCPVKSMLSRQSWELAVLRFLYIYIYSDFTL